MKYFNVLSNIAYPIAGFLHSVELGIAFLLLAVASAGYHYNELYWWQKADEIGMYLAFMTMIWIGIGSGLWQGLFLGGTTIAMAFLHKQFDSGFIGVLAALSVATHLAWIALPVYGLAMGLKYLEWEKIGPYHLVHGLWHLVTATAMYMTVL